MSDSVYPASLDAFTSPTGTEHQNLPSHSSQHRLANDAIAAVQATLGTNPQGGAATVGARVAAVESGLSGAVPNTRTVNGKALSANITLSPADVGAATAAQGAKADTALQTAPVTSVAGKTGAVTLAKADVGLGSVDNTADSAKAVASATKLATARTINGVSFDGTGNITVADSTKVPTTRTVSAGTGLTGGGDLSANRTLAVSYGTAAGTAAQGNDSRITGAVPNTRTVAGKALSSNVTLTASDVGAVKNEGSAPGLLVLTAAASIPGGTPTGTVIVRKPA